MAITGWRAALIVVGALIVIALLLTAVFWLAIVFAALLAAAWLNLFLLPRIAAKLHVPAWAPAALLVVLLVGGGYLLSGATGAIEGAVVSLLGVAAPRLVLWRLRARMRLRRSPSWGNEIIISSPRVRDRRLGRDPSD
jgi:hypothetical protein